MDGGILRGILLIIAMLALGGIIAFVGDRVGTKAGKARLRLGKLRPRQTASLVTVATGTLTAAIVTGILLATSKSLRQGIFRIREIRQERDIAELELENIRSERDAAEGARKRIQEDLDATRATLETAGVALEAAEVAKAEAEAAKGKTQQELDELIKSLDAEEFQAIQLQSEIETLKSEIGDLTKERLSLDTERTQLQGEIDERDRELASRLEEIELQEKELRARTALLRRQEALSENLTNQIGTQQEEIATLGVERDRLEQAALALRENLEASNRRVIDLKLTQAALESGEVIVAAAVQAGPNLSAREAIDNVLSTANSMAFEKLFPEAGEEKERQIIFIPENEVGRLQSDIADGNPYIIRVRSAQKYLPKEERVFVVIERIPDEEVFQLGDTIAVVRIGQEQVETRHIEDLTKLLFDRSESLLDGNVVYGDENFTLFNFIDRLQQLETPVDSIEAIAQEKIFLSGPLKVDLVARYQGQVVLSSNDSFALEREASLDDESALNQSSAQRASARRRRADR